MITINLLDLVPPLKRHLRQYLQSDDTDSTLAAYLGDGLTALSWRWTRDYAVTTVMPNTYSVDPAIVMADLRPVILMSSIIYKMGNSSLASYRDGDFAFDPVQGRTNPIALDIAELNGVIPLRKVQLAQAIRAPMRGFASVFNDETYTFFLGDMLRF